MAEKLVLYQLTVKAKTENTDTEQTREANLGVYSENIEWRDENLITMSEIEKLFEKKEVIS